MEEVVNLMLPCLLFKQPYPADRYNMPADLLFYYIRAPPPAI